MHDDWRKILRYAWSIRLIAVTALLSAIEFILPVFMDNPPVPRGLFAAFAFLVSIGAFSTRLIPQKVFRNDL